MEVADWLRSIGLGEYPEAFEKNAIGWDLLPTLTPRDLTDLGVMALGHRKKLLSAIEQLQQKTAAAPRRPAAAETRKQRLAAVVFVDLTGYTRLSESLDIEDLLQLERRFMTVMDGVIQERKFLEYTSYIARAGRGTFVEIHILVPPDFHIDIAAADAIRSEVSERLNAGSPTFWLTIDFTADRRWL